MRRRLAFLATLPCLLAAPAVLAAPFLETVPMADGTPLATDVWLPGGDGPWPVLLRRTPYGRALDESTGTGFNTLGYAVVSQDVRGRGDSQGRFLPFFDDRADGPDTMAWIAAQPWCNGRIGTWGGSAEGVVQLMALPDAPDALKCAAPMVAGDDVHRELFPGGAWRQELTTAWLEALHAPEALAEWRAHEAGDGWWDPARLDEAERARVRASVLLVGGVYDIFASGTIRTWEGLANRSASPSWLVLGPWTHGAVHAPDSGPLWEGQVAYPRAAGYREFFWDFVDFFDWCLKDGPRPTWAPLRYALTTLGDDGTSATAQWRTADRWEPNGALGSTLFLHPEGTLRAVRPGTDAAPAALPVDPAAPVPSVGGGNLTTAAGPHDQAAVDALPGVAVFRTAALDRDVTLLGEPRAFLHASSSGDDGDVVVRLSQVTPSGRVMLLADGVLRGRYREGTAAPVPLVPGRVEAWEVSLGPVAHVLPAGHALEVAVSGTSAPRYEPNPGSSAPLASSPQPVATTLTVFLDRDRGPSSITLPVVSGRPPWEDEAGADPDVVVEEFPPEPAADAAADAPDAAETPDAADVPAAADAPLDADAPPGPLPRPAASGCAAGSGARDARALLPVLLAMLSGYAGRRRPADGG